METGTEKPDRSVPKVLIIDDEMPMRFYLMTLVKSCGYEPVLAKDGVQGLDQLRQIKPAAIVLDIMMPEKGGAIVYQELIADPVWSGIPLIFFSGVDKQAFLHHIKMLNLNIKTDKIPDPGIYIAKDADPEYLKRVIKTCVEKS